MSTATRNSWDWLALASLGEQLRNVDSLSAQRDQIASMTSRLIDGKVDVWLQEMMFRLPDWSDGRIFPNQPSLEGMKRAIKSGKLVTKNGRTKKKRINLDLCFGPARGSGGYAGSASDHPPKGTSLL